MFCPTSSLISLTPCKITTKICKNSCRVSQDEARERELELEEGAFHAALDPRKPTIAPPAEDVPPHLNFAPLENALEALTKSAERYKTAFNKAEASGFPGSDKQLVG